MLKSTYKRFIYSFICFSFIFSGCTKMLSEEEFHNIVDNYYIEESSENNEFKSLESNENTSESYNNIQDKNEISEIKMTVVGDLMVHSWQMDDALKKGNGKYDFNYCFEHVKQYLSSADLTVGNLETTFSGKEIGYSDYPCFNTPEEFGNALMNVGFDVLSTANNHCMDKGENGVLKTIDYLNSIGISHMGTYNSEYEQKNILVKDVDGIKFAFLSYTYGTNGIPIPKGKDYLVNLIDMEKVKNDIKQAKLYNVDFIIVMPHMGIEYASSPNDEVIKQIDEMISAGADIVLASHPHVLQRMEMRNVKTENGQDTRKGFVIYSLANFISSQRDLPRDAGVILNLYFEKNNGKTSIKKISYIPTWVQWRDTSGGYNIRVLSVYDALLNPSKYMLREKDIKRLKDVCSESVNTLEGKKISWENGQPEYIFYNSNID